MSKNQFLTEKERDQLSSLAVHFRDEANVALWLAREAKNPDVADHHIAVAHDAIRNSNLLESLLIRDGMANAYLWEIVDNVTTRMIPRKF